MALTQVQAGMTVSPVLMTVNAGGTNPFPSSAGPTAVNFTDIPSWVKKITVMVAGVSLSGGSGLRFRLGTSGGVAISGYAGANSQLAGTINSTNYSAGFDCTVTSATDLVSGSIVFTNLTGNTWTTLGNMAMSTQARNMLICGSIALAGTLDRVQVTTLNGTDLFDAGSINVLYEG
jgi:hypothetical protein